jgi:hypothetical protein
MVPRRQFEDRYLIGGRPAAMRQTADGRWQPVAPGEARASMPDEAGHEPLSIVHVHAHGDGHGRQHSHLHAHSGDNRHSGDGHRHVPGRPDDSMPSVELNSAEGIEVSGIPLGEQIRRFLEGRGLNVDRELAEAQTAREIREARARERMQRAGHAAIRLRKAKRAAAHEQNGWLQHAPGFTWAKVAEARERVAQLEEALAEACLDDPATIAEARRRAAR